jgi:hypothetical protein
MWQNVAFLKEKGASLQKRKCGKILKTGKKVTRE